MNRRLISLVIPFFNEEDAIAPLFAKLDETLGRLADVEFEFVCVNDASTDGTLDRLLAVAGSRPRTIVVDLSRNFGKEAALSAGLETASGDAVIPMDADLQDPPELIESMLEQWRLGYEVVLARRDDRSDDGYFKRMSARMFYKAHNLIADVPLPEDVGDFRLMDRAVVEAIKRLPENCRFMKGLFAWIGFRTTTVTYRRGIRSAGRSRLKPWRLWNLAIEGVTSFSLSPLKVWTYLGLGIAFIAMIWGAWIALRTLLYGVDVPGYASIFVAILFLGGIQLIGIGVMGEYLGRTYLESKRRPAYVIRKVYGRSA
jgi:glycosyltransferase involved in cell wall biosynthesis